MDIEDKVYLDKVSDAMYKTIEILGYSKEEFLSNSRIRNLVNLRMVSAHYLLNNYLYDKNIHYSCVEKLFNRNRTTIFNHYISTAQTLLSYDDEFKILYSVYVDTFSQVSVGIIPNSKYEEESILSIQDDYAVVKGYKDFRDLLTHNIFNLNDVLTHIYEYSLCLQECLIDKQKIDAKEMYHKSGRKIPFTITRFLSNKKQIIK